MATCRTHLFCSLLSIQWSLVAASLNIIDAPYDDMGTEFDESAEHSCLAGLLEIGVLYYKVKPVG